MMSKLFHISQNLDERGEDQLGMISALPAAAAVIHPWKAVDPVASRSTVVAHESLRSGTHSVTTRLILRSIVPWLNVVPSVSSVSCLAIAT